ncbi:MAG: hypothetical protein IMZ46_20450 [Acidobacteria bacterium]|nr:hypothetical protein [Acidobacteriota bacterium]
MKKGMVALLALAFMMAIVLPVFAEDVTQDQKAEPKNLRKEIVKLKYVRAQDVQNVLYTFLSPDGRIQFNSNMPTVLAVSDTPENVEKILAAIREIDIKPADILFTVQLILGSEADAATDAELQNDPVVKELRKLLRYKGYTLLDATLIRVVNRERAIVVLGPKADFDFMLGPDVAGDAKAPVIKTEVRLRQITKPNTPGAIQGATGPSYTDLIMTSLNIKSGDRTVVGVSKLDGGDKGLILIISGKIVD